MRYHITWGTYGSWLPGDPRGFRTGKGREHVPYDYKNPPPPGLYAGLHAYARRSLKKAPVSIPKDLRQAVGCRCLDQFAKENVAVFVMSVGGEHVHAAIECPAEGLKQVIGRAKKVSSHGVRDRIPGRLWQAGCRAIPVHSDDYWRTLLQYIQDHAPHAWVWFRGGGAGE